MENVDLFGGWRAKQERRELRLKAISGLFYHSKMLTKFYYGNKLKFEHEKKFTFKRFEIF